MDHASGGRPVQRLLIIDDEPTVRRSLARAAPGALVREAGSVADAKRMLSDDGPFDIVICDVNLPDGLGWEVAHDALARHARAVMISGTDQSAPPYARDMRLRLVRKPFSPRALMRELGLDVELPVRNAVQSATTEPG